MLLIKFLASTYQPYLAKRWLHLFIMSICLLIVGSPIAVNAQLNSETGFYRNRVEFFDSNAVGQPGFCGGSAVALIGGDNVERAFTFLIQKGLTEAQAAGVVGNLHHESGVDPSRVEVKDGEPAGYRTFSSADEITAGRGYGIAQWTFGSRQEAWINFANERNLPVTDLGLQLEFLWHELTTGAERGYDELLEAQDVRQAAWIFLAFFERPSAISGFEGNPVQPTSGSAFNHLNTRHDYALEVLEQFSGVDPSLLNASCDLNVGGPDFSANGVNVDGSPPGVHRDSNCTGSFTAGAQVLLDFVMETWSPPVTSVGGYDCRMINNGQANQPTSIHGMGRALDIMIDGTTPEGLAVGDQIRNWMINNSEAIGVQRVIWMRHTWVSNRDGWRPYSGLPHDDHLHVEINLDGANMLTPWFQGQQ